MDQNNQNQQVGQSLTPQQPSQPEPLTTVQQPTDAQPTILPSETPAHPAETIQPPLNAAAPETPVSDANMQQATHMAPSGNDMASKKPLMIMFGIFIALLVVAGGLYVMGMGNKTQRLGMEIQKKPANTLPPTAAPTLLPEEQELNTIDLGNLEKDLQELDTEINTLQ